MIRQSCFITIAGLAACLFMVDVRFAASDTLRVPGDFETIQAAVKAAKPGDVVLVADGQYRGAGNRDIVFAGKPIVVRSENGPDKCIIDCEKAGRAFFFESGEPPEAVVEGFTITNGMTDRQLGGAIYCKNASPTIRNCVITGNSTGIFNGGGIFISGDSSTVVSDCIITENTAGGGGGVFLENNVKATIVNCVISKNTAGVGGGFLVSGGTPTIANCRITDNESTGDFFGGGAIFCNFSSPVVRNCTLANNKAKDLGGAVFCNRGGSPEFDNTIIWGNAPDQIHVEAGDPGLDYCVYQGGWDGRGANNINVDPQFVEPENGDYHIGDPESVAIDGGDPAFLPLPGERDMDGQARVWDGNGDDIRRVDIGADEFRSHVFADMNCDGSLDLPDVEPFIIALLDPDEYDGKYPDCDVNLADVNFDGSVDLVDVERFIELLLGA